MNWFKIILLVYLGAQIVVSIYQAGKGEHSMKITTPAQIISAIINSILVAGILLWW